MTENISFCSAKSCCHYRLIRLYIVRRQWCKSSSGAVTNFTVAGHRSGAKRRKNFWSCPSTIWL